MKFKPVLLLLGAIASVSVIASSMIVSNVTNAQAQENSQQTGKRQYRDKWSSLNLSDQQKAQMKQIKDQSRLQMQAVFTPEQLSKMQAAKGQRGNRREAMASLGLTEAQKATLKEIKKSSREKMLAVLTPEQQQQMRSAMQKRKQ